MPVPSTPTARPARGDSTPTGTRTRARTAPSNEDVARTAVSVFGDTTVGIYVLPDVLGAFKEAYPAIEVPAFE